MSVEDLIHGLTEPKKALLKQYAALFELDDVELEFTEAPVKSVTCCAAGMKAGARALRTIWSCPEIVDTSEKRENAQGGGGLLAK